MNLFRPFQMGEPRRDARGRLVGTDWYQDVLCRSVSIGSVKRPH